MNRTREVSDIGIGLAGAQGEKVKDIRIYPNAGSVEVWVELSDGTEAMQYLSCVEAMAFAKAFERCAVQALKDAV